MNKIIYNRIKPVLAEKRKTNKDLDDALKISTRNSFGCCTNSANPQLKDYPVVWCCHQPQLFEAVF